MKKRLLASVVTGFFLSGVYFESAQNAYASQSQFQSDSELADTSTFSADLDNFVMLANDYAKNKVTDKTIEAALNQLVYSLGKNKLFQKVGIDLPAVIGKEQSKVFLKALKKELLSKKVNSVFDKPKKFKKFGVGIVSSFGEDLVLDLATNFIVENLRGNGTNIFVVEAVNYILQRAPLYYKSKGNPYIILASETLLAIEVGVKVKDAYIEYNNEVIDAPKSEIASKFFDARQKNAKYFIDPDAKKALLAADILIAEIDQYIFTLKGDALNEAILYRNKALKELAQAVFNRRTADGFESLYSPSRLQDYISLTLEDRIYFSVNDSDARQLSNFTTLHGREYAAFYEKNKSIFPEIGLGLVVRVNSEIHATVIKEAMLPKKVYLSVLTHDSTFIPTYEAVQENQIPNEEHYNENEPIATNSPVETVTPNFVGRLSLVGTAAGQYPTYSSETMNASTTGPKPNGDVTFNTSNNAISGLIFGTPDTQGGLDRKFDHFVWGDWSGGSKYYTRDFDGIKFSNIGGYFVYGDAMPRGGLTGTAFYKGTLAGDIINQDQTISRGAVEGEIGIIANLDNGKLGGWLKTETPETDAYLVSDIDDAQIIKREKQVVFEGQLSGKDGQTGAIGGTFYGAKGEEIAGSFYIDHDYDYAGIFGASLTTEYPTRPTDYIPKVAQWAGQMSLAGGADANNLVYARSGINASGVAPTGPANSFLLFNDDEDNLSGNVKLNVFTDSPDNHDFEYLIAGEWSGGSKTYRRTSDSRTDSSATSFSNVGGYAVYGQLMPEHARTGTASYTGVLVGDSVGGNYDNYSGNSIVGEIGITADFGTGSLGGWMAFGVFLVEGRLVADIENASIYREKGVTGFRGQLGGNEYLTGGVGGQFYGPNGSELGGSYWLSVPQAGGGSSGIFAAWETDATPNKPESTFIFENSSPDPIFVSLATQLENGSSYGSNFFQKEEFSPATIGSAVFVNGVEGVRSGVSLEVPVSHGGGNVTADQNYGLGSYDYASWGKWSKSDLSPPAYQSGGYWVAGERTTANVVRGKTGTATYTGEMIGDFADDGIRNSANGKIQLTANFDQDTIASRMQWAHSNSVSKVVGSTTSIENGLFLSSGSDGETSFGTSGAFLGSSGQEIGGTAWLRDNNGSYNGVFRAKQGGSITFQTPSTGGVSSTPGVSGGGDEGGGSTATGGVADLGQSGGRDISVSQPNTATGF